MTYKINLGEFVEVTHESGIRVKIIAHSISEAGKEIITYQLRYHRFFHSEFMTHRDFSRSASSSRAIPILKILSQVWGEPAIPWHIGANMPGMQAHDELKGFRRGLFKFVWKSAARASVAFSWLMYKLGAHKQIGNRTTEPFQFINVVATMTELDNFFELRDHDDAQPEFKILAEMMKKAKSFSVPKLLRDGEWHLPYVFDHEVESYGYEDCLKFSSARCARVSFLNHDGKQPVPKKDIKLYYDLVGSDPKHSSPTEHQARPLNDPEQRSGNFVGWHQHRKDIE